MAVRAAWRPRVVSQADLVATAISLLVLIMPLDSFTRLTHMGSLSVTNVAAYGLIAFALLDLPNIVRLQAGAFWFWLTSFLIGVLVSAMASFSGPEPFDKSAVTLGQMFGLWAITSYAVTSPRGGERIIKWFLIGLSIAMTLYLVFHSIGFMVGENVERTILVAGYTANHAAYNAIYTVLLVIGTWRWWSRPLRLYLLFVAGPVSIYVVMLTNSRGALVSLGAGLLVFMVPGARQHRFRTLQSIVVLLGAVVILMAAVGTQRTERLFDRQLARLAEPVTAYEPAIRRTTILKVGLRLAAARPLGYGIGNGEKLLGRIQHRMGPLGTHDEYLRVLLGSGFLGLLLYLWGHGLLLRSSALELRRHGGAWALALLIAIQVSCLTSDLDGKESWIFMGLITGVASRRRRAAAMAAAPRPGEG